MDGYTEDKCHCGELGKNEQRQNGQYHQNSLRTLEFRSAKEEVYLDDQK
jgi:hypothetical protein